MAQAGPGRPAARTRCPQPQPVLSASLEAQPLSAGEEVSSFAEELPEATMTSNVQKCDDNRSKRKKEMEDEASENPQVPSLDKTDSAFSEGSQSPYKHEPLEKGLKEMTKEITNLLSKYTHVLSERAALDASYVQELDGILKEARTIESHLNQKRESLKQKLSAITNALQS